MTEKLALSAVVITKNEADRIERCVRSLTGLCAEVIVLDSGSSDATVELARAAGARVEHQDWLGFAEQKNAAIALATNRWVLLLDADEWLGDGSDSALRALFANKGVERAEIWKLQRRTHFLGTALNFGGWGRESVERVFRQPIRYWPALVHERLNSDGLRVKKTAIRIEHDTARSEAEYRQKLARYAELMAQQRFHSGRRAGALAAPLHAGFYFLKNVVLRGGFLDGIGGWRYHRCHIRYTYDKYRLLHAMSAAKPA
ncbi:MAG TPA: glycosyltransferase family 2 protein [Arenimonas sp.]|uniref:glycosyltransferase family 2 protein n=1 Tax=Arenimonas sp. TaxID=1872635 RepID=UPI002C379AE7|nr:glycosyltransferase family 2 protein [Arenimonas sp.]HMB57809.1 glycosyltransferase family 2 protein [Arenimonas sp.]